MVCAENFAIEKGEIPRRLFQFKAGLREPPGPSAKSVLDYVRKILLDELNSGRENASHAFYPDIPP